MRLPIICLATFAALTGCSDSDTSSESLTPDSPTSVAVAAVTSVDCASAAPSVTVTTPGFRFEPKASTIAVGEVVKFDPGDGHDVVSDVAGQFTVDLGGAACFRFDQVGTFGFHCRPHGFTGTIEVQ